MAQAVHDEAPVTELYLPIPHPEHALETAVAYFPAAHAVHSVNVVVYLPAGQAVQVVALAALYLPAAQTVQVADKPEAYLPDAQAAHALVGVAVETVPAAQLVHEAEPATA